MQQAFPRRYEVLFKSALYEEAAKIWGTEASSSSHTATQRAGFHYPDFGLIVAALGGALPQFSRGGS